MNLPNQVNRIKSWFLLQTKKAHYEILVGRSYHAFQAHRTFALGGLLGQDVSFESFLEGNLAGAGYLKTLLGAGVCFYFWHILIIC